MDENSSKQLKEELSLLIDDLVFKADLLRIAEKALSDIRAVCISSMYWKNDKYQNCSRILQHHNNIVSKAISEIENKKAEEYKDAHNLP
jgi:hypothetical protein